MKKTAYIFGIFFIAAVIFSSVPAYAAETGTLMADQVANYKAQVTRVLKDAVQDIPGTGAVGNYQTLELVILDGPKAGQTVTVDDDYVHLSKGDVVYLSDTIMAENGNEYYTIVEPYRLPTLLLFTIIFIVLVLLIGGWQGLRGLLSLAGSFFLIMYMLLPGILHGFSPVLVSVLVSSLIIVVGSYITHGFNKTTSAAVIGMIGTVLVTGLLAWWAVHMGNFTGYATDEAVYLNLNNGGHIDIGGILLGGIMIGLLGVLYDVAIGQAIAVEELHRIAPHVPARRIFARAMRMGREHIGALVNTLAIAYVGASLPLLLLFSQTISPEFPASFTLNREIFADQIIRTLIGSIGLVLAVPIVTLLAVFILIHLNKKKGGHTHAAAISSSALDHEQEALEHFTHHH